MPDVRRLRPILRKDASIFTVPQRNAESHSLRVREHRGPRSRSRLSRREGESRNTPRKCVTSCLDYLTQKCNTARRKVSMGKLHTHRGVASQERERHTFSLPESFVKRAGRARDETERGEQRGIPSPLEKRITGIAVFSLPREFFVRAARCCPMIQSRVGNANRDYFPKDTSFESRRAQLALNVIHLKI